MRTMKKGILRLFSTILNMFKVIFAIGKKIELSELVKEGKKVIEIDLKNTNFINLLEQSGAKYLGVTDGNTKKVLIERVRNSEVANRILDVNDYPTSFKNNADIIVLSGKSRDLLLEYSNFSHCNYIVIERSLYLHNYFKLIKPLFKHIFWSRINYFGMIINENAKFLVLKVQDKSPVRTRKYISPILGVEGFFSLLNQKNIGYVILRWFETLPLIQPDEDIDLLVTDDDIAKIESILNEEPGLIPSDIYSVTGIPGYDYHGMAYYPPFLAKEILNQVDFYQNKYKVPNRKNYFLSLTYHAVYHKGEKSGIKSNYINNVYKDPEHEYSSILKEMANENKYDVEITLEGLSDYLTTNGWLPPKDTLARLYHKDKWIKEHFNMANDQNAVGLVVFIFREKAIELNKEKELLAFLENEGFDILFTKEIKEKDKEYVSNRIRGGNWGQGPYKSSGGQPALLIAAYDLIPQTPNTEQLKKYPNIDNARVLMKSVIRNQINKTLPSNQQCNMIHSSNNYAEAIDYITVAASEFLGTKLKTRIKKLQGDFKTEQEVLKDLTRNGRRAKVELIKYKEGIAVKKTFRSNFLHFCQREIFVMKSFNKKIEGVMELLEFGDNYFIVPFYKDSLKFHENQTTLLPLKVSRKAFSILRKFYENGYALVDFHPGNIIYEKGQGLKIFDFEFIYKYRENERPEKFENSYDVVGLPNSFVGEKPILGLIYSRNYDNTWKKHVGLNLDSLLYNNLLIQRLQVILLILLELPKKGLMKIYTAVVER